MQRVHNAAQRVKVAVHWFSQRKRSKKSVPTELNYRTSRTGKEDSEESGLKSLNSKYSIEHDQIGAGKFGDVYKGCCIETNERVAFKFITRNEGSCENAVIRAEIDALKKVSGHKSIMRFYDMFFDKSVVVLVLEYCRGGELFQRIIDYGLYSERSAARHFCQIADALAFMHSQGCVHRDLKPENLLLKDNDPDSDLVIGDFGLAKLLKKDQSIMSTRCGTREYSAPELRLGDKTHKVVKYTAKVDTWSAGTILYVILAGYHPFDPYGEGSDAEIWSKIEHGLYDFNAPSWREVSEHCKDLVCQLLVVDPTHRLSAKQVLSHPWVERQKALSNKPLSSSSRSLLELPSSKAAIESPSSAPVDFRKC